MNRESFKKRFGPFALVLGGSEGLGFALAEALAKRGINVIITGRRENILNEAAAQLTGQYGVKVSAVPCDLSDSRASEILRKRTRDTEINCIVYNAAVAPNGPFLDLTENEIDELTTANIVNMMKIVSHYGKDMAKRKRGSVILMSSLASLQGSGWLAGYVSSKSFIRVFGESLWSELKPEGVRVLVCLAGATGTPNFKHSGFSTAAPSFPPVLEPRKVAETVMRKLPGSGPIVIPGFWNRFSAGFLALLPKSAAVGIMSATARKAYQLKGN